MIYLDNNASTRLDPAVWEAMAASAEVFGNPSSVHAAGQAARRAVEEARDAVGELIGASEGLVLLTSGGTEANAMAVFGAVGRRSGRIVLSGVEHPSVREPARRIAAEARCEVVEVAPDRSGVLDPGRVLDAAVPRTARVSARTANNE